MALLAVPRACLFVPCRTERADEKGSCYMRATFRRRPTWPPTHVILRQKHKAPRLTKTLAPHGEDSCPARQKLQGCAAKTTALAGGNSPAGLERGDTSPQKHAFSLRQRPPCTIPKLKPDDRLRLGNERKSSLFSLHCSRLALSLHGATRRNRHTPIYIIYITQNS